MKDNTKIGLATLEARALAIINAPEGFNRDTRRAVELSLNDLRVTVRRAEAGETVCDTTDPELKDPPRADDLEAFARHLAEVLRFARTNPVVTPRFYNRRTRGASTKTHSTAAARSPSPKSTSGSSSAARRRA
jgi:hypothetical protein